MRIDAVVDFVCPWCFIGHARLMQAIAARPSVAAEVVVRPYLLDPAVPDAGYDLRARLRARYGADPERMFARVEQAARDSGLVLDFTKVTRYPSTVRAHVLRAVAAEAGVEHAVVLALFAAYFQAGEDIGDVEVLVRIGTAAGLHADTIRSALVDPDAVAAVRADADAMRARGIDGVPWFSLEDRAYIRGAESVQAMTAAVDRASAT